MRLGQEPATGTLKSAHAPTCPVPELPEVETIRRGLERELVGRRVEAAEACGGPLRSPSPLPLGRLAGRRFAAARRHAKFLLLDLDRGVLVVHLGMTGKLLFAAQGGPRRAHTHLVLRLDDGRELRYVDPRRFGMLRLYRDARDVEEARHYGIDALDPALDDAVLGALLQRSRAPLKAFLLDQTKVAGLGNIYACEALWRAGLSPRRLARNTPASRVPALRGAIVGVLHDSLAQGGTSFNDYVDHIGQPGRFLLDLAVFQRDGGACRRCDADVRRIVQSGRSTFFCPGCQR